MNTDLLSPISRQTTPANFLQRSHPEPDERGFTLDVETPAETYRINERLHAWLLAYRDQPGESNNTIASRLGYKSGALVSKYLNRKPEGNVADFEARVSDLMARAAEAKPLAASETFATSVTRQFATFADTLLNTRQRGVLTGAAGLGKTIAAAEYCARRASVIFITLDMASRDDHGIRRLLFGTFEHRGKSWRCEPRWDLICDHYKNSGRLLIVDQAQRITKAGLFLLHDFSDRTGVPQLLIGNPDLLELVGEDAQVFRRTFQHHNVTLKDPTTAARKLVDIHAPDHASEHVYDLACRSVQRPGHLGLVVNTLLTANDYVHTPACEGDYVKAYTAAHSKSVHGSIPL